MREPIKEPATQTRRNLLSAAAVAPLSAAFLSGAASGSDAELIRLCAEHIANLEAYNAAPGCLEGAQDPLWDAYERTGDAISASPPKTIAGLVAKARVAVAEAKGATIDGAECWDGSSGTYWAREIVYDLLRLYGRA